MGKAAPCIPRQAKPLKDQVFKNTNSLFGASEEGGSAETVIRLHNTLENFNSIWMVVVSRSGRDLDENVEIPFLH